MSRVDIALEKLLSVPDTSIQGLDEDPVHQAFAAKLLAGENPQLDADFENLPSFEERLGLPDTSLQIRDDDPRRLWLRMEENCEKLVGLAREFVAALDEEGGSGMLRQRALRFISLTAANPSVNIPRQKAYQRIMEAFRQASPGIEAKRLKVSQLNIGTGSGSCPDKYVYRSDVERNLAGAGSLVWDPHRCCKSYRYLADITGDDEFVSLANETENCLAIIDAFHLWGCFLLLASHDEVLPTANPHLYRNLREFLRNRREPVSALKEAAKVVAATWRTEKEQRGSQAEALGTGTEEQGIDTEAPKAGDTRKRSKPKQPVAETILVKLGYQSFQLVARGCHPVSIDGTPFYQLFMLFVLRIVRGSPGETVPLLELNEAVGKQDEPKRATQSVRNAIDELRKKLSAFGRPPDGEEFILTTRRKGYRLNTSCAWRPAGAVREEYAPPDLHSTNSQAMAENTPDSEHKLPAKRGLRGVRSDDDD